jgi:CheY-like chemotaxis protein
VMNGWQFLSAVLADSRLNRIPVVALTAAPIKSAQGLGVVQVLSKPIDLQLVLRTLARLVTANPASVNPS